MAGLAVGHCKRMICILQIKVNNKESDNVRLSVPWEDSQMGSFPNIHPSKILLSSAGDGSWSL